MDAKLISISSDSENSFVIDLVQKNVPKVARYEDYVVQKIIFLGFFHFVGPERLKSRTNEG